MKPFKFRVWCFENNKWIEDNCSLNHKGELFLHTTFESHNITNDKRFEFSCSTGLFDKNNKEIFSDDIIKTYDEGDLESGKYLVEYQGYHGYPAFELKNHPFIECNALSFCVMENAGKIIDNKFENHEILEYLK